MKTQSRILLIATPLLACALIATTVCVQFTKISPTNTYDGGAPKGLKVYREGSILRNGEFEQKGLGREAPAHWSGTSRSYWAEKPEDLALYSLKDGVLRIQVPAQGIYQRFYVTPVTALDYTLSLEAEVDAGGRLDCSVHGVENTGVQGWKRHIMLSTQINEGKGFVAYSFPFKSDSSSDAWGWEVEFRPQGADGTVFKIRNVALKPILPETKVNAKDLFIDDAGKTVPLRGIAVVDNDSAFEHFYDLKAAQYLRKYLYVSFGRVVTIYTGSKAAIEKEKGLVCFGKSLIADHGMAKVTAGGYALEASDGNIYVAGKDDGAVHGAFALLSGMGLEFFGTLNDFTAATNAVIRLAKTKMTRNPSFAYRSVDMDVTLSKAPLGDSCVELFGKGDYVGRRGSDLHYNGILVDPFIYFKDHPEYYAPSKYDAFSYAYRQMMNLCWSNPEVQRIATKTALRWFELVPEMKILTYIQGDGEDPSALCQCDNCKRFGVNVTDRYLRFVNVIAKAVREKYPDKLINSWAYCITAEPPVTVIPETNVILGIGICGTPWGKNGSPDETRINALSCLPGINQASSWMKTGVQCGPCLYFPTTYEAVNKIRFFGDRGARTLFGIYANPKDLLTLYVMRKLAWDFATDVEPVIDRFMTFYYGPAAPAMRKYFNLVEDKKLAFAKGVGQGDLGSDYIPLVVDDESLDKGREYLDQAEVLVKRDDGRQMIRKQRLDFLNSYLLRNNSALLQGEKLERFAKCLGESLMRAKEFNDMAPRYGMTYPEMVWCTTGIQIGDAKPWYNSPVFQKIVDDTLGMIKANKKGTYEKTEKGLKFLMQACIGAEETTNYQYEEKPKTKQPFSKVLRRATSPKSGISATFTLSGVPEQGASIQLVGLNDDKTGTAFFKVLVNGQSVFDGKNTFDANDWTQMTISIPAKILKKGLNTLEVKNTTPEKIAAVADIFEPKDYLWGWIMIAEVQLVFAQGNNPVVAAKSKIKMDIKGDFTEIKPDGFPAGWVPNRPNSWDEAGTVSVEKVADIGKNALHVTSQTKAMHIYNNLPSKRWPISAGDTCHIKAMVKGSGMGSLGVYYYSGGQHKNVIFSASGKWREINADIVMPMNAKLTEMCAVLAISSGASIEFMDVSAEIVKGGL
ncbi:MAG: DUF4838 domain-containing protein [Phycisphaerae bacterium]|jgi:hypothetical protein